MVMVMVMGHGSWVMGHGSWVMGHGSWVIIYPWLQTSVKMVRNRMRGIIVMGNRPGITHRNLRCVFPRPHEDKTRQNKTRRDKTRQAEKGQGKTKTETRCVAAAELLCWRRVLRCAVCCLLFALFCLVSRLVPCLLSSTQSYFLLFVCHLLEPNNVLLALPWKESVPSTCVKYTHATASAGRW
jgi:hypothetical protein